jgi:putative membrane protein
MMHWWWDGGAPMPWFGMILGPITMIAVIAILVLILAYPLRAFGLGSYGSSPEKSAFDILKERFARGEIDRAEYEERKRLLSAS